MSPLTELNSSKTIEMSESIRHPNMRTEFVRSRIPDSEQILPLGEFTILADYVLPTISRRKNPRIKCDRIRRIQVRSIRYGNEIVPTIKCKCLSDHARRKGRAVLQCTMIAIGDIICISIPRPPAHQPRWRLYADLSDSLSHWKKQKGKD